MIDSGLVDEVEGLLSLGLDSSYNSMQGIGYKEVVDYLEGKTTLEVAKDNIKKNTRHFAKRQLTWFRREDNVIWVDKSKYDYDNERILSYMTGIINNG